MKQTSHACVINTVHFLYRKKQIQIHTKYKRALTYSYLQTGASKASLCVKKRSKYFASSLRCTELLSLCTTRQENTNLNVRKNGGNWLKFKLSLDIKRVWAEICDTSSTIGPKIDAQVDRGISQIRGHNSTHHFMDLLSTTEQ